MVNPLRFIMAIVAGVFVAFILMSLLQSFGPTIFSYESLKDGANSREFMKYIDGLPSKAFWFMGFTYILASFFGAYVGARISRSKKQEAGISVALFLLVMSVFFFISLPHPLLFSVITCVGLLLGGFLGMRLGSGD